MAIVPSCRFQAAVAWAATAPTLHVRASALRFPTAPAALTYDTATCIPTLAFLLVSKVSHPPATTPEPCCPTSPPAEPRPAPEPPAAPPDPPALEPPAAPPDPPDPPALKVFLTGSCFPRSVTAVPPAFLVTVAGSVPPQVPVAVNGRSNRAAKYTV